MNFEKWQALGNDYLILKQGDLPWELTPARVRALCANHTGVGADGVLMLAPATDAQHVAQLRIFNPDGSEAELSGNGARQACLYLRRNGWTNADEFTVLTAAGAIRPVITGPTTCRIHLGRARLTSADFPDAPPDGRGTLAAGGEAWEFQHVSIGNPQCAIAVDTLDGLAALDLADLGPHITNSQLFPHRTNVSWFTPDPAGGIRARIFERGVGETLSSGTGASGAAVAHVLQGGSSPVDVHLEGGVLEVAVDDELEVTLTGWAVPVYRGELSPELVEELDETE